MNAISPEKCREQLEKWEYVSELANRNSRLFKGLADEFKSNFILI